MKTQIREIELSVESEIGRLRQVGVHIPGLESEYMTPSNKETLLFDDILFVKDAQKEHDVFQKMMSTLGVQVYEVEDLLAECLKGHSGDIVDDVIKIQKEIEKEIGNNWVYAYESSLRKKLKAGLASKLITSVYADAEGPTALKFNQSDDPFLLTPIPNILFMRDPAAVVGNNVIVGKMTKPARRREAYLLHLIFDCIFKRSEKNPESPAQKMFDFFDEHKKDDGDDEAKSLNIEGGDVLVINPQTLAIGCSERTTREFVQEVVSRMVNKKNKPEWEKIKTIIAVLMPMQRSTMHLDTIFTMINNNECLVYEPMIMARGREQVMAISYTVDDKGQLCIYQKADVVTAVQNAMREYLEDPTYILTPYPCGGENPIHQEREQWNDGANVLALAPGIIVGYNRNLKTFGILRDKAQYKIVDADEIIRNEKLAKKILNAMDHGSGEKYAIRIPGYELSRARGGPRCMSMPLLRENVKW